MDPTAPPARGFAITDSIQEGKGGKKNSVRGGGIGTQGVDARAGESEDLGSVAGGKIYTETEKVSKRFWGQRKGEGNEEEEKGGRGGERRACKSKASTRNSTGPTE